MSCQGVKDFHQFSGLLLKDFGINDTQALALRTLFHLNFPAAGNVPLPQIMFRMWMLGSSSVRSEVGGVSVTYGTVKMP